MRRFVIAALIGVFFSVSLSYAGDWWVEVSTKSSQRDKTYSHTVKCTRTGRHETVINPNVFDRSTGFIWTRTGERFPSEMEALKAACGISKHKSRRDGRRLRRVR